MSDEVAASGGIAASGSDAGVASPAAQPADTSGSAAPAAQGTESSASTDSTREGFIPRQRFDEVNTRMTNAERALSEFRRYERQLQEMARAQQDPVAYALELMEELGAHPEHSKTLRSQAGRMLRAARLQAPAEDAEPEPDLQTESGQFVYSAKQQKAREEWFQRQLDAKYSAQIEPLKQFQTEQQQQAQLAKVQRDSQEWATKTLQERQKLPHYMEHRKEIRELMAANPEWDDKDAYIHVLSTKVLPSLSQTEQAKVLSDLKHKANAGTVNPGSPSTGQSFKPKSFREALEHFDKHPDEAAALAQR